LLDDPTNDYEARPENGVAIIDHLSETEIDNFWSAYNRIFGDLSDKHPCAQGFEEQEFRAAMVDPEITKFISFQDGEAVTLCFMGDNLATFPWVNKEEYERRFGEDSENPQHVMYFPGLFTVEGARKEKHALNVVSLITDV